MFASLLRAFLPLTVSSSNYAEDVLPTGRGDDLECVARPSRLDGAKSDEQLISSLCGQRGRLCVGAEDETEGRHCAGR